MCCVRRVVVRRVLVCRHHLSFMSCQCQCSCRTDEGRGQSNLEARWKEIMELVSSPFRGDRGQGQRLYQLCLPGHSSNGFCVIHPLSSPLFALQPIRIEVGYVEFVEVIR